LICVETYLLLSGNGIVHIQSEFLAGAASNRKQKQKGQERKEGEEKKREKIEKGRR